MTTTTVKRGEEASEALAILLGAAAAAGHGVPWRLSRDWNRGLVLTCMDDAALSEPEELAVQTLTNCGWTKETEPDGLVLRWARRTTL